MCWSELLIFDEFGGILTQLSTILKTRMRCADSVVHGYHVTWISGIKRLETNLM